MKNLKTAIIFLMVLLMLSSSFGCKKKPSNSSDGEQGSSGGDSSTEQPADDEKVTLLFEIDEGLAGYEFVAGCKKPDGSFDFDKMDVFLNNVYNGVKGLK